MASITKSVLSYQHTQPSTATVWTITHNLNTPGVVLDVLVNNGGVLEKVIPLDITMTSVNVVTIHFDQPWAGTVRIVG